MVGQTTVYNLLLNGRPDYSAELGVAGRMLYCIVMGLRLAVVHITVYYRKLGRW